MSKSNFTRRGMLKTSAVAGGALAMPTIFDGSVWADAHAGYLNAPQGDTVTLGFNVPQSGPYADEGADELLPALLRPAAEATEREAEHAAPGDVREARGEHARQRERVGDDLPLGA